MVKVLIGTSSWSDHQYFYPQDLPKNQQIVYYSQRFPVVEINSTYYHLMPRRNFELWAERTPDDFVFDVKPHRQLTWHDRKNPPSDEAAQAFADVLEPLREANKLGALNFQLAPWVVHKPSNLDYLWRMRQNFPKDVFCVEFRHRSWYDDTHFKPLLEQLRAHDISLTIVDEPQIGSGSVPTDLRVSSSKLVLVRLHGRNKKMWYAKVKRSTQRFDYLYSREELTGWLRMMTTLIDRAQEIHVLFNNNARDYAVRNARQLRMILREFLPAADIPVLPMEDD